MAIVRPRKLGSGWNLKPLYSKCFSWLQHSASYLHHTPEHVFAYGGIRNLDSGASILYSCSHIRVSYMYILVPKNRLHLFDFIFRLQLLLPYILSSAKFHLRMMTMEFVATRLKMLRTTYDVEMIDEFNNISNICMKFVFMIPNILCSTIK